jgi:hypothetical protein
MATHPTSFYVEELRTALSEQGSLIRSFEVTELAALEASARVITLEDELVVVHLNSQGYCVRQIIATLTTCYIRSRVCCIERLYRVGL